MKKKKQNRPIYKRIIKWLVSILVVLLILLFTAPYLFKDKINEFIIDSINKNISAKATFNDTDLSFFRNFPLASVSIDGFTIVNNAPFEGDTLFYSDKLFLKMNITELFKGKEESMSIKSVSSKNSQFTCIINKENKANYDIVAKKSASTAESSNTSPFSLEIENYSVENLDFSYIDKSSKINFDLKDIYHSGKGNFNQNTFNLDTHTKASLSLKIDNSEYMKEVPISLDAILGIDLENSKYSFKENTAYINKLPLEFHGHIQLSEMAQFYNIDFNTPTSSFINLLALLPAKYAGNIENVKTKGDFSVNGLIKGTLSETKIPGFDITFTSKNAMFKYPNLPKSVRNINISSRIINKSGSLQDTYVELNTFSFKIDQDVFNATGTIQKVTQNPAIQLNANGIINLENISKVYPISTDDSFSGIMSANISTSFDMNSIEKKLYKNIKSNGNIRLQEFEYTGAELAKPFLINNALVSFNSDQVILKKFIGKTGNSDVSIQGNLENMYGFLFKSEILKGRFFMDSNIFDTSDFMSASSTDNESSSETFKVPAFLNASFTANVKKVIYDNLNLTNVEGVLFIKDKTITLQNLKMDVFNGNIQAKGNIFTKEKIPTFDIDLDLKNLDITQSFSQLDMLNSIAPIANTVGGKMNSVIHLSGDLKKDLTPNLATISGDLIGRLFNTKINTKGSKLLNAIDDKVSFIDANKINLNDMSTTLFFKEGKVTVKPFQIKYNDIPIQISGAHGFDKSMDYDLTLDVPVKYFGKEVNNYITTLSSKDKKEMSNIPVKIDLTGSFSNPIVTTDVQQVTKNLINTLIKKKKDNLIDKGKNKLLDLFNKKKKKGN